MAGLKDSEVRSPAVAGLFYPADDQACRIQAQEYLKPRGDLLPLQARPVGGLVPHAGWVCSGAIAGQAVATLAQHGQADVVVVFGAVHTPLPIGRAALDSHERWRVPGGESPLSTEVRRQLATESPDLFVIDDRLHAHEHAVEVELPLIQRAFPHAAILPVEVPLNENAVAIGRQTARRLAKAGLAAMFLASSDLTHYGPNYGFVPAGLGMTALEWAKDNDRRLLQLVKSLSPERIVPEVHSRLNACGGGAIAAMLAACRQMGASRATILEHANSYETLAAVAPQTPENAVGYAGVVVH